jgi:hypothetical protein
LIDKEEDDDDNDDDEDADEEEQRLGNDRSIDKLLLLFIYAEQRRCARCKRAKNSSSGKVFDVDRLIDVFLDELGVRMGVCTVDELV